MTQTPDATIASRRGGCRFCCEAAGLERRFWYEYSQSGAYLDALRRMGFADAINPDGTMDDQLRARGWTFHEGGAHAPAGVVDPKFNPTGPLGVHPGDASIRRGRMTLQVELDEDGNPTMGTEPPPD